MNADFETVIRRACERDVEILLRLVEEFMPAEASENERLRVLKTVLKNSDYDLWIAEVNEKLLDLLINGLSTTLLMEANSALYKTFTWRLSIGGKAWRKNFFNKSLEAQRIKE